MTSQQPVICDVAVPTIAKIDPLKMARLILHLLFISELEFEIPNVVQLHVCYHLLLVQNFFRRASVVEISELLDLTLHSII